MSTTSRLAIHLGIAAAVVALALPARAQTTKSAPSPYDLAAARAKQAAVKGIFFGNKAAKGAYPFMVALILAESPDDEEGNFGGQYCGGTLISDRFVVTAAQCVTMQDETQGPVSIEPGIVDVYVGSNDFKDGKRIKVKRIVRHPKYDVETFNNDIAVLELAASAASNRTGTAAPVTPQNESAVAGVGKKVIAAGWGLMEDGEIPKELRYVEMDVLDSGMCNANIINYRKANALEAWLRQAQVQYDLSDAIVKQVRGLVEGNTGKVVSDTMLCAGRVRTQRDTCQNDNGGPLFAPLPGGKFALVGITSWGEGCGQSDQGLYGVYTRVSNFSEWVQQTAK